jgi:hypothetical protein
VTVIPVDHHFDRYSGSFAGTTAATGSSSSVYASMLSIKTFVSYLKF